MQIHVVLGLNGPQSVEALNANVQRVYPGDLHYRMPGKPIWLVADDALARQISVKLGIDTAEQSIAGMVTTIANYYGRANPEIWTWMKTIYERPSIVPGKGESDLNVGTEIRVKVEDTGAMAAR